MYDDVLLPTDGSDVTDAAEQAGRIAATFDATVHVLSVVDERNRFESPSAGLAPDVWERAETDRAQTAVRETAAALPDDVAVETVLESGIPQAVILDYVETHDVDLVVMGTHGRTGLDHYLIGSVAERVVRNSPVPVLTAPIDG